LTYTRILDLKSICERRDYQGVIDPSPVHIVKALHRVAKYIDASDSRAGVVCHDVDVLFPFEVFCDIDPEIAEPFDHGDPIECVGLVTISGPQCITTCFFWLSLADECHEFCFRRVSFKAVSAKSIKGYLIASYD
jgi:hypothetical protein